MKTDFSDLIREELFIDGEFCHALSGETLELINPSTGKAITRVQSGNGEDIDRAVGVAQRAFQEGPWPALSHRERAKLLFRIADAMEAQLAELFTLETLCNGRPVNETRTQIIRVPDYFRYFAGLALAQRSDLIPVEGPYLNYINKVPVGVVGNSSPFNHPIMIMCKSLAACLAAGCTTVVKPSELTPLSTLYLAELFCDAGLPPGVFNVVPGTGPVAGRALAAHPTLGKFVLTGGTEAGRAAAALAARNFTSLTLELGGNSPVLVFEDVDLEQVVNMATFGQFIGAGQTCIAANRFIVQRTLYETFCEALKAKTEQIRVGDPFDEATQMGPVISEHARSRVLEYVEVGKLEGATLLTGGGRATVPGFEGGFFLQPTIFKDVTPDMRIGQAEVFGPFAIVTPFDSEEDAVRIANDSPYALGAGLHTNDLTRAHDIARRLRAGLVWINDHHRNDPASPWGGFGDSGMGREYGSESFESYFLPQSIWVRLNKTPFDWYRDTHKQKRLN